MLRALNELIIGTKHDDREEKQQIHLPWEEPLRINGLFSSQQLCSLHSLLLVSSTTLVLLFRQLACVLSLQGAGCGGVS